MADYSRAINRVFTRGVINDMLQNGSNDIFDYVVFRYVKNFENKTHRDLFSEIYTYLGKERRNEYYYMNTLLIELLSGIHNVNTTIALSQVHIGHHIADFIMINGEGRVYEIKSDLDNLDRLSAQLSDYYKAFSKVSVLSSIHELDKVEHILSKLGDMGDSVGIYVLSEFDTIFGKVYSREPRQYDDFLEHNCIFKLLRKYEYENILMVYYGDIPKVTPVLHFRACIEQFNKIPIQQAQKLTLEELKKRMQIKEHTFESIQSELKSVIYFSGLTRKLPDIDQLLQTSYRR